MSDKELNMVDILEIGLTIASEIYEVHEAIEKDERHGTSRNTVEALAGAITSIGCVVNEKAEKKGDQGTVAIVQNTMDRQVKKQIVKNATSTFLNSMGYEVEEKRCKTCFKQFQCKKSDAASSRYCQRCLSAITY